MDVQSSLDQNISYLEMVFKDCGDIVKRRLALGYNKSIDSYITYIDMLTDRKLIELSILPQLMMGIRETPTDLEMLKGNVFNALKDGGITTADLKESNNFEDINMALLSGDTAIFIEGYPKAIVVSTKGFPNRGVSAVENEVTVQGPRDAFTEVFRFNTTLVRRRIKDTKLKIKQVKIGQRSATDVAIMYLEDVVRPKILNEVEKRINNINIDAILDVGYVEQLIEEDWLSPFPQNQVTERPDKAASAILEGRIVIIVDNSPFALIVPATLNTFFQSPEDYYQRFEIMSFIRVIRYIAGIFAVILPGLYIATAVYHPSMISMMLVLKIAGAREAVPFPGVIEIIIMDLAFELLREAGIRLPGAVGGTIGIVGGIIIGQAAVEAGLVSPIVVIVIALTGISSFPIPSISLVSGFRIMKYLVIILSGCLGLFGFWIAVLFILIHLVSLKSFGIPYMYPYTSSELNNFSDLKDSIIRVPLFAMEKRPIFANPSEKIRLKPNSTGKKRKKE